MAETGHVAPLECCTEMVVPLPAWSVHGPIDALPAGMDSWVQYASSLSNDYSGTQRIPRLKQPLPSAWHESGEGQSPVTLPSGPRQHW